MEDILHQSLANYNRGNDIWRIKYKTCFVLNVLNDQNPGNCHLHYTNSSSFYTEKCVDHKTHMIFPNLVDFYILLPNAKTLKMEQGKI